MTGNPCFGTLLYRALLFGLNFSRDNRNRTCTNASDWYCPFGYSHFVMLPLHHISWSSLSSKSPIANLRINLDLLPKSFSSYQLGLPIWFSTPRSQDRNRTCKPKCQSLTQTTNSGLSYLYSLPNTSWLLRLPFRHLTNARLSEQSINTNIIVMTQQIYAKLISQANLYL